MITLIKTTKELIDIRKDIQPGISFVPTMGNLHQGHLSLLEEALKTSSDVFFSIFVNPKQFGPNEDFNKYPRTLENDLELIKKTLEKYPHRKIYIFAPESIDEIFPRDYEQTFNVLHLSKELEGEIRPGHFQGVATVVFELFKLIKPHIAFLGQKDFQQLLVIKQMVHDLHLPIKIKGMPIIRDMDGLALSSRNQYLSFTEREEALHLSRTLFKLESHLDKNHNNIDSTRQLIRKELKDPRWNYLEIRDAQNLNSDISHSKEIVLLGVFQIGKTRLLDNILIPLKPIENHYE
jgi:pantoate--beta-alanine ligase